jgi:hypothetical protein
MALPGVGMPEQVLNEFLEDLDLFNKLDERSLRTRIHDKAYYRNFIALARNIAPDGDAIKTVGFTQFRDGKPREVALTKPRDEIPPELAPTAMLPESEALIELKGRLSYADAIKEGHNQIKIVPEKGPPTTAIVPEGMMDDIVRPMWGRGWQNMKPWSPNQATAAPIKT